MRRKIALHLVTAVLLFVHSMTAVIGEAAGLGYQLVLKHRPSLLKSVANQEQRMWDRAVASGEIPEWVVAKRYVVLANGSAEEKTQPWERAYVAFVLLTWVCTIASLTSIVRSVMAAVRGREAEAT
jgi:hypothetical protein